MWCARRSIKFNVIIIIVIFARRALSRKYDTLHTDGRSSLRNTLAHERRRLCLLYSPYHVITHRWNVHIVDDWQSCCCCLITRVAFSTVIIIIIIVIIILFRNKNNIILIMNVCVCECVVITVRVYIPCTVVADRVMRAVHVYVMPGPFWSAKIISASYQYGQDNMNYYFFFF